MIGYVAKDDSYIAASTDNINGIKCYNGTKLYLYDTKETKINLNNQWYDYKLPVIGGGGGSGVIENGSIVTEMFAVDAKAPLAGVADSVASAGISDASAIGKSLIKAVDAGVARTAIGAGTGSSNLAVATTAPASLATTAAIGTGTTAARADHVHAFPTAANVGAAPTSHTHTTANITGLDTTLASKLTATKGVAVADSAATDIEGVNAVLNALLASLRTGQVITT